MVFIISQYINVLLYCRNRQCGPYLELFRCFSYFAFEYLLIGSFVWQITEEAFIFTTNLYVIRLVHIFSVVFWLIYIMLEWINGHNKYKLDNEKEIKSKACQEVEECAHKVVKMRIEKILFASVVIFILFSFLFAFALNMKSCEIIVNRIIFKKI